MADVVDQLADLLHAAAKELDLSAGLHPRGVIRRVGDGVAFIVGLEEGDQYCVLAPFLSTILVQLL